MNQSWSPTTRVMDFIEFKNIFIKKKLFDYMIKIDAHKIEYQPKNKNLFDTIISIESKQKSIMQSISQSIQY